ncbi:MAG TPA: insulinase family protein [Pyrinomonadaceae bacterium]|nr:insulinase family protein [Pyrinomonadaceae bacterium]
MTRTSAIYRCLYAFGFLVFAGIVSYSPAQSASSPTRELLLNGLPVLYWQRPGDNNVFMKLRLNSGAAFDLAGKAGTMALLSDALFPDPATREYVTDELGGRLEVATSYDSIDVTISGKASQVERIVELLRNAIIGLNLSGESVTKLREARIAQLGKAPPSASLIADRTTAARLFGTFPYGRPAEGDLESLPKVDRADLMLAQERFLHSDNAALVVIGGVDKARLMRALRQLLGPWQKGDRKVASTFRQPDAPGDRTLLINQAGSTNTEIRLAVRGLARSDRDAIAASMLAQIARERWQAAIPELSSTIVRHEAHTLPGMFVFAASVPSAAAQKALTAGQDVMKTLAQTEPTAAELDRARSVVLAEFGKSGSELDLIADAWLDSEILKTSLTANPANEISRVSVADIQRVATRLFKDTGQARVVVGDIEQLKSTVTNIELPHAKPALKPSSEPQRPATKP